jgi:hypothetical protein
VVRLQDVLTPESITASIYQSAKAPAYIARKENKNKLEVFVEESLLEYIEAMEVHPSSVTVSHFAVDLRKHYRDMDLPEEVFWFNRELCLLSDGKNIYTQPYELADYSPRTLGDFQSFFNRLVSADVLYVAPTFDSPYHSRATLVSERYKGLPEDLRERLNQMNSVKLSVRLTDVELTDSENRQLFKRSQAHIEEDPVGYDDYDIKFDTLMLKCHARSSVDSRSTAQNDSISFSLPLPVMFRVQQPGFVSKALQQKTPGKEYYPRYLSGARSFKQLFPELTAVTKHLNSIIPKDLERYLEDQRLLSDAPISLLGIQISRDLIEVWGVLLMLCVQLYFCTHYRTLIDRIASNGNVLFPWIGLYHDVVSTAVFQVSVALPLAVCSFLAIRDGLDEMAVSPLATVRVLIALGLLIWTEVIFVRYRRISAKQAKATAEVDY